jgi:hypothetical protein
MRALQNEAYSLQEKGFNIRSHLLAHLFHKQLFPHQVFVRGCLFRSLTNAAAMPDLTSHIVSVSASSGQIIVYAFDLLTFPVPIYGMSKRIFSAYFKKNN